MMGNADEKGLSTIGQIALTVYDLGRAVAFYRDTLHIPFLFSVPTMAFFDCDGVRLMLALPEDEGAISNAMLYYRVSDLEAKTQVLQEKGVKMTSAPHLIAKMSDHELWMAFFEDPDGNAFALMSEVKSKEA
jgi:methylmalonyl-CoA/ethylmalonyl-CoA epimerase